MHNAICDCCYHNVGLEIHENENYELDDTFVGKVVLENASYTKCPKCGDTFLQYIDSLRLSVLLKKITTELLDKIPDSNFIGYDTMFGIFQKHGIEHCLPSREYCESYSLEVVDQEPISGELTILRMLFFKKKGENPTQYLLQSVLLFCKAYNRKYKWSCGRFDLTKDLYTPIDELIPEKIKQLSEISEEDDPR